LTINEERKMGTHTQHQAKNPKPSMSSHLSLLVDCQLDFVYHEKPAIAVTFSREMHFISH